MSKLSKRTIKVIALAGGAWLGWTASGLMASSSQPPEGEKPAAPAKTDPPTTPATPTPAPSTPKPETPAAKPEETKPVSTKTLENGLVIEDLKIGDGAECKPGASVVAHYRGTFKADGKEFDSSYSRNAPATFWLGSVIKGWTEGVPGMKVGGKRRLTIPYMLAYGEGGRRGIPPKADLVFDIELMEVMNTSDVATDEKVGGGKEVGMASTVKVYYRGTLKENGKEFDSNVGKEPIEFPLRAVIPGWQTGMLGMKVGGKRKLVIPWKFAYGEQGSPPVIPPKADLVFEIELLAVN